MPRSLTSVAEAIDQLITVEIEARPGESDGVISQLYAAARDDAGGPLAMTAAQGIIDAVEPGSTVVVSSGWVIDRWFPHGELCGMLGASALARFLSVGLQCRVLFPAEPEVRPVMESALRSVGVRVYDYDFFRELTAPVVGFLDFPKEDEEAARVADEVVTDLSPAAAITVEKCGRNAQGVYCTGRGSDMSPTTSRIDDLLARIGQAGGFTVGVGDLGNEIGFGRIHDAAEAILGPAYRTADGMSIVTAAPTDALVVASASNRGGYGLEAMLAAMTGTQAAQHTDSMQQAMIRAAAQAGAIDSFTVAPTATDGHGVAGELSGAIVGLLGHVAASVDTSFPLFGARA